MKRNIGLGMLTALAAVLVLVATNSFGQSAVIRGESGAGNYPNVQVDSSGYLYTRPATAAGQITITESIITVTNATQALIAANANRKYLAIQNLHATATVQVNFGAAAALTTNFNIGPGATVWFDNVVPTAAINLIGSVASNTTVVVLEGI